MARLRKVLTLVVAVAVLAACSGDDDAGRGAAAATTSSSAPPVLEVVTEWPCVAIPADLVELADVVVVGQPVSPETTLDERVPADGSRIEERATQLEVVEVLAGDRIQAGEIITVARSVEHRVVIVDGAEVEHRVEGEGYPGPLVADGYVLALTDDSELARQVGVWIVPAGAHGRVALDGTADTAEVLDPAPGDDGRLQTELTGETLAELEQALASPAAASPCGPAEDAHG
jgi:hypothetical protein